MMNALYHHYDYIEDKVKCSSCYELPNNIIYQCMSGHHNCETCKNGYELCNLCNLRITKTRNFSAESLVTLLKKLKDRQNGVDGVVATPAVDTPNRLLSCPPTPRGRYRCPVECCTRRRKWSLRELCPHLSTDHPESYYKFKNKYSKFQRTFDQLLLEKRGTYKVARVFRVSNMGLFYLMVGVSQAGYLHCWLSMPAPLLYARQFSCRITFCWKGGKPVRAHDTWVASDLKTDDLLWLLERAHIFILAPSEHQLDIGDKFLLKIQISFEPSETPENS